MNNAMLIYNESEYASANCSIPKTKGGHKIAMDN